MFIECPDYDPDARVDEVHLGPPWTDRTRDVSLYQGGRLVGRLEAPEEEAARLLRWFRRTWRPSVREVLAEHFRSRPAPRPDAAVAR